MLATLCWYCVSISEQTQRGLCDVVDGAREAAAFRKGEPIDRAISTDAGNATEQSIPCNLTRNKTGIELKDDFMPGNFPKIIRIRKPSIEHAQFLGSQSDSGDQTRAFAAIEIEDGNSFACLLAELPRDDQRAEMISREHFPLARPDENPRALARSAMKNPSVDRQWDRELE